MRIEDFVKDLEIENEVEYDNGVATVILKDSNDYAKVYTLLSDSDLVDLEPESVVINQELTSLKLTNEDFEVTLSADLERDIYKLVIEEVI